MGYRTVCFTFIRHAESETNASGKFTDDPANPLTDHGRRQARSLAAKWAASTIRTDALFCSPMTRALDTATMLVNAANAAQATGNVTRASTAQGSLSRGGIGGVTGSNTSTRLTVAIDGRLHERTYGARVCSNTLTDNEVYRELRGTFNRVAPIRSYKPLGGGESYSDVAQRGLKFVLSVLQNPKLTRDCTKLYEGKGVEGRYDWRSCELGEVPEGMPHVVVVSHNIFLTLLYETLCQWGDGDWDSPVHNWNTARDYLLPNCGWSRHVISWRPLCELKPEEQQQLKGNARIFGPIQIIDLQLGGGDKSLLTY
ncbi:phosphoglycerate mutase-like protein [Schizopora paradoxa]|uniref:Phosphoglycerate mutase-like protein n=1 Tax=Schizopora paradoxa TaxID=27342 RepID=A0A0H2RKP7_9AGAM|nr:phosphoglycerate mutase-like protein [Schizopora paradoxa]